MCARIGEALLEPVSIVQLQDEEADAPMSATATPRHRWRTLQARASGAQLPFFVWLIALWMLLWGQFTVLAFVTGLVVAVFVTRVFRLPPVELSGRVNLWYGLVFVAEFLVALRPRLAHGRVAGARPAAVSRARRSSPCRCAPTTT